MKMISLFGIAFATIGSICDAVPARPTVLMSPTNRCGIEVFDLADGTYNVFVKVQRRDENGNWLDSWWRGAPIHTTIKPARALWLHVSSNQGTFGEAILSDANNRLIEFGNHPTGEMIHAIRSPNFLQCVR